MKNQYFGDVNDYRKYGLLRALQSSWDGSLLVAWMLTPDDSGQDGGFRSYLKALHTWAKYDPELFAGLTDLFRSALAPSVSLLEESGLLPRARYYSAIVPDKLIERDAWRDDLIREALGADLVFLDPDNGIEVPSRPAGRVRSSKYVMWREIQAFWEAGSSLLIYQHVRREKRDIFALRLISEVRRRTGAGCAEAFLTPNVLYLLAIQDRHLELLGSTVNTLSAQWNGQIDCMGISSRPNEPPRRRSA